MTANARKIRTESRACKYGGRSDAADSAVGSETGSGSAIFMEQGSGLPSSAKASHGVNPRGMLPNTTGMNPVARSNDGSGGFCQQTLD